MTATETTWPDDVIIRYRTVGGATVDITSVEPDDEEPYTEATCLGCDWRDISSWDDLNGHLSLRETANNALDSAKKAAQDHASVCRAMPKPDGEQ